MTAGDASPARELSAAVDVGAPSEAVWAAVTDFAAMPRWSPELLKMVPLKRGGLRLGQWYLGLNRRGPVVWPTRNVISVLEPGRRVGWDTPTSGARWVYDVTGNGEHTRLGLTRSVPRRLTRMGNLVARTLLGGTGSHADELEVGMHTSLERIREAVEAQVRGR